MCFNRIFKCPRAVEYHMPAIYLFTPVFPVPRVVSRSLSWRLGYLSSCLSEKLMCPFHDHSTELC